MIKKIKNKSRSNKRTSKDGKATIVQLSEGWNKINKVGIEPFFERVENIDDKNKLKKIAMDTQQYIEVYDTIFTMCIQREPHNFSAQLYNKHSEALTKQFKSKFIPSLLCKKKEAAIIFLKEWDKRWRCCKWDVIGMTRMFMYLDRFHVPNSEDLLNTTQQGYTIYRENVFAQFKDTAKNAILGCIERERNGEEQDRDLLRDSIAVFVELGNKLKKVELQIYKDDFNKYLLSNTRQYYKLKSRGELDILSCPQYLIFAEKCINDELSRLSNYIDKYSENGLMDTIRNELLKIHQKELLIDKKSGINAILNRTIGTEVQSAREDLSRLFRLYSQVKDGLNEIAKAMRSHVTDLGINFIEKSKNAGNNADAHELMTQLIGLHDRFLNIVKHEFDSEAIFHKCLKEAFESFINKEYYVSGLLARYANDLLKKGNKLSNSSTLEMTMDHVVMIYGYIRDKDIFERDYQLYLSSRLLHNLSQSEQSERSMIGKLKNEAGYHWTSKLEAMFKDIQTSKELMDGFKKNKSRNIDEIFTCELNVSICTTGSWPDSSINPVKIPYEDIGEVSDVFKTYYLSRFSGRKLRYQMDKGKADVQVVFNSKIKKILVVSTYQMLVLLLFNNKKTITFKEMKDLTNINSEDLESSVLSMAHPKIKVLRKAPNTKELEPSHKFQINPNYNNPKTRIIIPIISIRPKKDITNKIDTKILTQRRYMMDAAIVRTMKTRKTLQHKELITEVVHQLIKRFNPKPQLVKKRIIALIDQEYLQRDRDNRNVYHYIS